MNTEQALVTFTQELVGIPSLSGHEKQVAQTIQRKMAELHYDEVIIDGFGSVIGKIHGKNQGKTVLLDGHIDHVDVIDRADWKYDPFGAVIDNGKIYGRAASDMKGSVAAMILSAADFRADTKGDFDGTICVACTVHEECFEGVSAREISRSVHPDFVIIGEATSGTLKIGQRGRAEVVVETEGKSCHSSNPEKGVNAVYHMVSVIEALREIKHTHHGVLGEGILELTDIISLPYPGASVVPSRCIATFDRRTLIGESQDSILEPIREQISKLQQDFPDLKAAVHLQRSQEECWTGTTISAERYFPAWLMDRDSEIVQKSLRGLQKVGINAPISHFSFCTNGSHYCGEAGIPTVGFGPSLESLAHVRDEYIEISELVKAYHGFKGIMEELLR